MTFLDARLGSLEDSQVVRRVLDGDAEAYALLVERHSARLFRLVSVQVPQPDVEEVVQESFLNAFRALGRLRRAESFGAWIGSIAMRLCVDCWRRHSAEGRFVEHGAELPETGSGADEGWNRALLTSLLRRLSPEDRLVLNLLHAREYSCEEIASCMGWSVSKVKVRAHRARAFLRRELDRDRQDMARR